jgi:hypothetical protein
LEPIMKTVVATLFVVALVAADPVLACGGQHSYGNVYRTAQVIRTANVAPRNKKSDAPPRVAAPLTQSLTDRDQRAKVGSLVCKKYFSEVGELLTVPCSG